MTVEQPAETEFRFPPGLEPSEPEFWPVTFDYFDDANPNALSTSTVPDPRWPSDYHEGAFVPYGESFRLSLGMLAPMAQDTAGPYRVFVSAWVDYEPVAIQIVAPTPGREDNYFEGRASRAIFEVPEFPVVIDLEFPAESLGERGLHDVVVVYRVSTPDRARSARTSERFSIFYGGNQRVGQHPCFVLGETLPMTDQEKGLFNSTHFFYIDEQSIPEQREGFQETVSSDQEEIVLTLASPLSNAPELDRSMSEVLFVFRNEELLFQEHLGRHSQFLVGSENQLSRRRELRVELPLEEDRFEVWGFSVQHPYQSELVYETGNIDPDVAFMVDLIQGTYDYRIRRE